MGGCVTNKHSSFVQVNTNGILSFRFPFSSSFVRTFPFLSVPLIAPYWENFDLRTGGNLFYRQTSNTTLLQTVQDLLQESLPSARSFFPTSLFIATWDRVPGRFQGFGLVCVYACTKYYIVRLRLVPSNCSRLNIFTNFCKAVYCYYLHFLLFCPVQENTFQVVVATNGQISFVFFIYSNIEWGSANIGFNAGNGMRFFMAPGALTSQTRNIVNGSNVGILGLYIYRVDARFVLEGENSRVRLQSLSPYAINSVVTLVPYPTPRAFVLTGIIQELLQLLTQYPSFDTMSMVAVVDIYLNMSNRRS